MAWYFNFCAPTIPNDPIINGNRLFQTGCLLGFLFLYICIHAYYKLFGPDPLEEKQLASSSNGSDGSSDKNSDQNTQHRDDDKSISIAGGLHGGDENSSYVTLTKTKQKLPRRKVGQSKTKKMRYEVIENVTIQEIQSFFPIVFGHFAIASTFTVMYSPYTEQSIAMILYVILSILLMIFNSRRLIKTTRVVWGFMCFLICFLVMSALLEVGQANYNKIRKQCFAVNYQPLY